MNEGRLPRAPEATALPLAGARVYQNSEGEATTLKLAAVHCDTYSAPVHTYGAVVES